MFHSVICSPSTFVQSLCEPMLKYCTASMWMPGILPPSMFQGGNCHCLVTTLGYGEIVTFLTADFFKKSNRSFVKSPIFDHPKSNAISSKVKLWLYPPQSYMFLLKNRPQPLRDAPAAPCLGGWRMYLYSHPFNPLLTLKPRPTELTAEMVTKVIKCALVAANPFFILHSSTLWWILKQQ